jgi:hypothetical protein
MKAPSWAILGVLAAFLCRGLLAGDNAPGWSRGWTSEGPGWAGLKLIGVDQSKNLRGYFDYYNFSKENSRTEPIVIAGVRSVTGEFWADATLQVKRTVASEWEAVGKSTGKGQPEMIKVAPNDHSGGFMINFDDFKRFMITHKIGRVTISSGATAEFNLEALTPPLSGGN